MIVQVKLFANLKDLAGSRLITVTVPDAGRVQDLITAVAAQYPTLAPGLSSVIVAINQEFAPPEMLLPAGAEIALFPPVSGGEAVPTYFALTEESFDLNRIEAEIWRPDIGAVVFFSGRVRGETNRAGLPAETMHLQYEAYEEMALRKMAQIAAEIWQRWPLVRGVAIVQRIGRVEVGDSTTLVACAAAHRDQGCFAAAEYGIERLKEIVPVWKKEVGVDQTVWVEGHYHPFQAHD